MDPSTGAVADGCAVGGQAADLGFSGGIGTMMQGPIISDSGQQASLPGNFVLVQVMIIKNSMCVYVVLLH